MDLAYPVGKCEYPEVVSREMRERHIAQLEAAPGHLRAAVRGLTDPQLDTPYRPGGWTVRQVVHHFADSHMNAYVRIRLALTEEVPTIKPYDEKKWAELKDASTEQSKLPSSYSRRSTGAGWFYSGPWRTPILAGGCGTPNRGCCGLTRISRLMIGIAAITWLTSPGSGSA